MSPIIEKSITLVLPCYNPPGGWCSNVLTHIESLRQQLPDVQWSLILINDGSSPALSENDIQLLQQKVPDFQFISYPINRGKGFALRQGVVQVKTEICIYTDLDFPYTEESLLNIARELLSGNSDIAAGVKGKGYYAHVPPIRRFISRLLQWMTKSFLRLPHSDTQCGLKGFNQKGREVFLQTAIDRYLFDLEFIYLAARSPGIRTKFMEATLREDIRFSKIGPGLLLKEGFSFFNLLWRKWTSSFRSIHSCWPE